jgi:hypothetical protein
VHAPEPEGRPDVHDSLGQRPRTDPDDQDRDRPAGVADCPQRDGHLEALTLALLFGLLSLIYGYRRANLAIFDAQLNASINVL